MDDQAVSNKPPINNSTRFLIASICFFISVYVLTSILSRKSIIGATADVTELTSGMILKARVDTGASVSSLHCKDIVIDDAEEEPEENSGKKVRFLLEGPNGENHWIESRILGFAGVRNVSGIAGRYRVRMQLQCEGLKKETIVSLNDRSEMKYPLLLGRDFLEDNFVVDVSCNDPDYP